MANLSAAIHRVRRARRRAEAEPQGNFDEYRPEYEAVLDALAELAGDAAFDELSEWLVETTTERKQLPAPAELRRRARQICKRRGVTVPEDSPIRD